MKKSLKFFVMLGFAGAGTQLHALQSLSDESLSQVSGQDGIIITTDAQSATIGSAVWEDEPGKQLSINNLQVSGVGGNRVGASVQLQAGTAGLDTPGVQVELRLSPITVSADSISLDDVNNANPAETLGRFAMKTTQDTVLSINTANGFLNQQGNSQVKLVLDNADIYLTQEELQGGSSVYNQLVAGNLRLDVTINGQIYVDDAGGLVVHADQLVLNENGADAGIQVALLHKANTGVDASSFSTTGANGIVRLGASGALTNVDVRLRGTSSVGATPTDPTLAVVGERGIALSLGGELENGLTSSNPVSYDLSEAGVNGYGIRFSDVRPFDPSQTRAPFSFGTTYINLVNLNQISLPQNKLVRAANTQINGVYLATQLANPADFVQNLTNKERLAIMNRGFELQGIAQQAEFIQNPGSTNAAPVNAADTFAIVPDVHDVNANLTLAEAGAGQLTAAQDGATLDFAERMDFSMALSTTGISADGRKTTSILVADTASNTYLGLRNIDLLASGEGTLGVSTRGIHVNFSRLLVAFNTEIAAGLLPTLSDIDGSGNLTTFRRQTDTLFVLRGRLLSNDFKFDLLPPNNLAEENYIGYAADVTLDPAGSSFLQITDPNDSSTVGFDTMTGRLRIDDGRIDILADGGRFYNSIRVNPQNTAADVLRIQDVNFYPAVKNGSGVTTSLGAPQRLGELVMTGGRITADLTLRPVN